MVDRTHACYAYDASVDVDVLREGGDLARVSLSNNSGWYARSGSP